MAQLLVVRHGETIWNATERLQGQLQSDLNESGKKQAAAVADRLAKQRIHAIYSSDLRRAVDTAQVIADRCAIPKIILKEGLRERHLGILQGLSIQEARHHADTKSSKAFFTQSANEPIAGGGESLEELYNRTQAALEEIAQDHQGETVVVVTHGGVLRALHVHATGFPASGKALNASLNVFTISPDLEWKLVAWGDVQHLGEVGYLNTGFGGGKASA